MKKLLFLLLFLPFIGFSQGGTWPVRYSDSDPSGAPSAAGTRLYFNTATNTLFFWEPAPSSTWRKQPKAFDQITGCAAPAYTPTARQSTFAVNSCAVPELYQWTGAAWVQLNEGAVYTAGTGIAISGGNVISNTGDLSATNELNTSLSVSGSNLQIVDAGGTLTVPVSDIAPVQAVATGSGINISGTTTRTISAVDASATNELQTLSIAGQDLTLSNGGGTVALPEGADGNGIYGGSGTIPDGTVATAQGNFSILGADQTVDDGGNISIIPSNSEDGNGGRLILKSGSSTNGIGGKLTFTAGSGIVGGGFSMFGGQSNGLGEEGGPASLNGGESTNGGKGGDVSLTAGSGATNGKIILNSWGVDFIGIDLATRDLISSPVQGTTIFCTDATATDGSTGVMQVYNGSVWKNAW